MTRIFLAALLLLTLLYPTVLRAQAPPLLNQNPPRIRWQQTLSPHFQVIYPAGYDSVAQRTTNVLETIYRPASRTLGKEPRPIPIILQNQTTISNGFVTVGPRRSEFFTTPPQDYTLLGNLHWMDLLAVHEFRHVVQIDKANTGYSRVFSYLFGDYGLSTVFNIMLPPWFREGDAVGIETALTNGGRGRTPRFTLEFRNNLLTRGPFSYAKATLGSYKDFVPNHYVSGYLLTTHARRQYGAQVWDKALTRTFHVPYIPFGFSRGIRKETGLRVERLYKQNMQELDSLWRQQLEGLEESPVQHLPTARNRVFTNYEYPQYLSDGRILAQKSGLADVMQYVILDGQTGEQRAFIPGPVNESGMLSVANDVVLWSEFGFDPRWRMVNYSVLKAYDLKTGTLRQITSRSRLHAPSFSPDGNRITAIESTETDGYSILILDAQDGTVLQRLPNPENYFYLMPRFSDTGTEIVAVKLMPEGKTITLFDLATGQARDLIPVTEDNIAHAVKAGPWVYFNSPHNGLDLVWAVHAETGRQYNVVSRKWAAYNATVSPDGSQIAFHDYTSDGFRIATLPIDTTQWVALENVTDRNVRYYEPLIEQETGGNILESIATAEPQGFPTNTYRPARNLFRIHSWMPNLDAQGRGLTLEAFSQDLLSTTVATAGVGYNANERAGSFFGQVSYQGWFPVIDAGISSTTRNTTIIREDGAISDSWRVNSLNLGVRIPLILTRSRYSESLTFDVNNSLSYVNGYDLPVRSLSIQTNGWLSAMRYGVSYRRIHKASLRDVLPPWGQTLFVRYTHTPFGGDFRGGLLATEANVFVPGLLRHHGVRMRGSYQYENTTDNYRFSSPLFFPRGYLYTSHQHFYNGSAEYALPLFNPDWRLGRWLYIPRFTSSLFYDLGRGTTASNQQRFYDVAGIDLRMEFHVMRFFPRLEVGVRGMYKPREGQFLFQPLIIDVGF
jgi:hypothetical protein